MTKYYFIIPKSELSPDIIQLAGQVGVSKLLPLLAANGSESSYMLLSITKTSIPPELKDYKALTKTELDSRLEKLRAGLTFSFKKPNAAKISAFEDSEGKRARFRGCALIETAAGETKSVDYQLAEDRYVDGAVYDCVGANFGDNVSMEIVHPISNQVLDDFVQNWYVLDGAVHLKVYPARVPAGLILRFTYNNVGPNPAKFMINLRLHAV
jgi:hypothetical protein